MAAHKQGLPPSPLEGYPAYGAVHDIRPAGIRDFLYDFGRIADGVFADEIEPAEVNPIPDYTSDEEFDDTPILLGDDSETEEAVETVSLQIIDPNTRLPRVIEANANYDSRQYYRVFDPESLGVSVVEMDPSRRAAQAVRAIWEKNDFGAVENEARNEIDRILPANVAKLRFNRVEGVGRRLANYPKDDVQQKLALMPDTNEFIETYDLIEREAEIIIRAIRSRLKQFVYPWDITPHLTFAVFRTGADPDQIKHIKSVTNKRLAEQPMVVPLGDLTFRHKIARSKKRR
jgi:hypothetical protein